MGWVRQSRRAAGSRRGNPACERLPQAHLLRLAGCHLLAADGQVGQGDEHTRRLATLDQCLDGAVKAGEGGSGQPREGNAHSTSASQLPSHAAQAERGQETCRPTAADPP